MLTGKERQEQARLARKLEAMQRHEKNKKVVRSGNVSSHLAKCTDERLMDMGFYRYDQDKDVSKLRRLEQQLNALKREKPLKVKRIVKG